MSHTILFSGHMIDRPGREKPRFPESKVVVVSQAITAAVGKLSEEGKAFHGIAAAACGGDILFHEACRSLGIPSEIYLGTPVDAFEETSVAFAGLDWVERYRRLVSELPVHVLFPEATAKVGDEVWEKANEWMLGVALDGSGSETTLIVLWDGEGGDGPGGTRHMVNVAKAKGANAVVIAIPEEG